MNLALKTQQARQVLDITDDIQSVIDKAGFKTGVAAVGVRHTTCGLTTADLDPGTDLDFLDFLQSLVPDKQWRHPHDPAHAPAHLLSSLIGPSLTLPVAGGRLQLGTWQRIILVELDGPRERELSLNLLAAA